MDKIKWLKVMPFFSSLTQGFRFVLECSSLVSGISLVFYIVLLVHVWLKLYTIPTVTGSLCDLLRGLCTPALYQSCIPNLTFSDEGTSAFTVASCIGPVKMSCMCCCWRCPLEQRPLAWQIFSGHSWFKRNYHEATSCLFLNIAPLDHGWWN